MRKRDDEWIVHPPDPEGGERWWVVAVLLAGPAIALAVWLLGG